jgi:hypothetical protein
MLDFGEHNPEDGYVGDLNVIDVERELCTPGVNLTKRFFFITGAPAK